jgi:hypothetical protein
VRGLATITVTSTTIVAIADHAVKDSSPYYRLLPGNEPVRRAATEEISVRACSVAVVVSRVRRSSEEPAWPALVEEAPGPLATTASVCRRPASSSTCTDQCSSRCQSVAGSALRRSLAPAERKKMTRTRDTKGQEG